MNLIIEPANKEQLKWAQEQVILHHYRHTAVDPRCRPFAYIVWLSAEPVGCLIYGRPQATRCYTGKLTYGSYQDVQARKARFDRWEILNLARVWLSPSIQRDGSEYVPHAASLVIRESMKRIGFDYLMQAPPVDCAFPYQIRCIMSYCDTKYHSGWIYMASRFKYSHKNDDGKVTYMKVIPGLTDQQDAYIQCLAEMNSRSQRIRAKRNQLTFKEMMA